MKLPPIIPARSTAAELLDQAPPEKEPGAVWASDAIVRRNLREMALLYRLTGGLRLSWRAIHGLIGDHPRRAIALLDLATGDGSLPLGLVARARRHGLALRPVISDIQTGVVRIASAAAPATPIVQADARRGPWRADGVDIVHCAQALHHFTPAEAGALLADWARIARRGVVVVDLNRSWLGYVGARLAALGPMTPLGRHDGPLSVLRAYTRREALALARDAGIANARVISNPIYWALVYPGQP